MFQSFPSLLIVLLPRPKQEHTEIEEELHEIAHIDYNRVSIVSPYPIWM